MPKKCDHLEGCDDCAKRIPDPPSDQVARIQQILTTMERKRQELSAARSNENRFKISVERSIKEHRRAVESAENSLEQTKIQLEAELRKFDEYASPVKEAVNA